MDKYYLDQVFGETGKQSNGNVIYHCPACNHRKYKLSINLQKHIFQCWVCGFKGKGLYKIFNLLHTPQDVRDRYQAIKGIKTKEDYTSDDFGKLMWDKLYGNDEFI